MDLNQTGAEAAITLPNGIGGRLRKKLRVVGESGFFELLRTVEKRVRPILRQSKGSTALVYAVQRHFRSQKSAGENDARLEVDLRTILTGKRREATYQPEWARAIHQVLIHKRSNIQFGFAIRFPYTCPVIRSHSALNLFSGAWTAMSPVIGFVLGE
jgi:hypothetical protein